MQYNDENEYKKGLKTLHVLFKDNVVQMTFYASQSHIWSSYMSFGSEVVITRFNRRKERVTVQ